MGQFERGQLITVLHGIDVGGGAVGWDGDVNGGGGGDDDVGGGGDGEDDVVGGGDGEGSLSVWRSRPCFPRQRQHSSWIARMMITFNQNQ